MRRLSVQGPVGRISVLTHDCDSSLLPVVFVHGVNGAAAQWQPVACHLAERELVAVDLRGHGDSQPGGSYGAADYATDVSAAMSALGISRAHLAGASFGGGVCVTLAATEPHVVASLTIIGGALSIADTADAEVAVTTLRRLGPELFFEQTAALSFGPNADDEMLAESVRLAVCRGDAVIEQVLRAALVADVSAAAARSSVPARVLTGEYDQTCSPALGAVLAAALQTDCTVLPGLGHMAHIEGSQQVASRLIEHIHQVESPDEAATVRGC